MRSLIGMVVAALVLAGCGNAAEEISERAIEAGGGANAEVELDLDDDGQGEVVIETEDGSQSMSFGSGELPDELEVPLPDGYEVVASSVLEQGEEKIVTATVAYSDGDIDEIIGHFEAYFEDLDGAFNKTESSLEGSRQVLWFSEAPGTNVSVVQADDVVQVTVTQQS